MVCIPAKVLVLPIDVITGYANLCFVEYYARNWNKWIKDNIDGLVHERRNPSALAIELRLSCTNPLICELFLIQ